MIVIAPDWEFPFELTCDASFNDYHSSELGVPI